jgi:hypothetical protein
LCRREYLVGETVSFAAEGVGPPSRSIGVEGGTRKMVAPNRPPPGDFGRLGPGFVSIHRSFTGTPVGGAGETRDLPVRIDAVVASGTIGG